MQARWLDKRKSRQRGFTLAELMVVLLILLLLMGLGAPMLSKLLKTSRVMQAANTCMTMMYRARAEAMRYRLPVAVYFGDDQTKYPTQPTPGILPPYGQIEIWTVKLAPPTATGSYWYTDSGSHLINDGFNTRNYQPWNSAGNGAITFDTPDRPLTPNPVTFEDGTRILCGHYSNTGVNRTFYFSTYQNSARGELKRHAITLTGSGTSASYSDSYSYRYILVFDVTTGEHVIIEAAEYKAATRPRIMMGSSGPQYLSHVGKRTSGTTVFSVKSFQNIIQWIDQ